MDVKTAVFEKWMRKDNYFHCESCGKIIVAARDKGKWLLPIDLVLESDEKYATCLCAICLQERSRADCA